MKLQTILDQSSDTVTLVKTAGVYFVVIGKANDLNGFEFLDEMDEILDKVYRDNDTKCLICIGKGQECFTTPIRSLMKWRQEEFLSK